MEQIHQEGKHVVGQNVGYCRKKKENKYCLHPNHVNNKYAADGEPRTSEPLQTPK